MPIWIIYAILISTKIDRALSGSYSDFIHYYVDMRYYLFLKYMHWLFCFKCNLLHRTRFKHNISKFIIWKIVIIRTVRTTIDISW